MFMRMRPLLTVGILLVVIGVTLLFVPISHREKHAINAGPISVGVTTTDRQLAPPAVTATIIAAGVVLMIAGGRKRR